MDIINREPVCGECLKYDQERGLCKMPLPSWARTIRASREVPPWRGISCCVFFDKAREDSDAAGRGKGEK